MKENETMEQQTQQAEQAAKGLQDALMQAALGGQVSGEGESSGALKKVEKSTEAESFVKGGAPGPGRPKGVANKATRTIRDAVMQAFEEVGGPEYLVRLANGTQSDRAAFTSLLNKVLPTQITANVEGGIKLELSWLGSRSIGTTQAQLADTQPQVIDLEQESNGKYRIKDQDTPPAGGDAGGKGQEGAKDA